MARRVICWPVGIKLRYQILWAVHKSQAVQHHCFYGLSNTHLATILAYNLVICPMRSIRTFGTFGGAKIVTSGYAKI